MTQKDKTSFAPSRRALLAGSLSGVAAATLLPKAALSANKAPKQMIDVHHHPTFKSFRDAVGGTPGQMGITQSWTIQKSLDEMEKGGVAKTLLSLPVTNEVWADEKKAIGRTREWNEYMAGLAHDHPGHFGVMALLPTPYPDAALAEIAYAYDTLKVTGIGITTNIGDKWLGDPHYAPILEELNRRKAVVFVHPAVANCCKNLMPDISEATIELGTDTTRAITRLLFSGSAAKYRDIKFIFSHAGGTVPFTVGRLFRAIKVDPKLAAAVPNGVLPELQRFHYDVALAANPYAMSSLKQLVPVSQIVLGTDFPFASAEETMTGLMDCGLFSDSDLEAIGRENMRRVLNA